MKILILTSSFGMGHYCAAEAIKEDLLLENSDDIIEIVDIVEILFPSFHKVIYKFFGSFMCRFSWIYKFINIFVTKHENGNIRNQSLKKINKLVNEHNPDLIVCTWSACSRYVSAFKEKYKNNTTLYTYITDINAHDGWITNKTDMYFVGAKSTKQLLISKGISPKNIIINGIPVRSSFKEKLYPKSIINNYGQAINNNSSKKQILIMGGGLGLIPDLDNILNQLCKAQNINITIITGKNKKLFKDLKKNYPKIEVVAYTDEVDKYMKKSDLLITKPGGISTFEAIYTSTPLYVIRPFLSQEIGNAKFIENMAIGKIIWESDFDISQDVINLLENDELMSQMKLNMRSIRNEVSQCKLKKVYERSVRKDVDYNTTCDYSGIFDDIWSHSHIVL